MDYVIVGIVVGGGGEFCFLSGSWVFFKEGVVCVFD